jgi:tetratricopeptide (TPR) repeat protein
LVKTAGVAFIVDDLLAWLVGLLADAGRKKLTALVLGSDQERALRQAATAAIEATAAQLAPAGGERAGQLAMVVGEVFRGSPGVALAGQTTLLEALQTGIAARLAVLDDPAVTGTGQSSAELLGVPGSVLAETLAGDLVREIMVRGARGGQLAPLADQLNHDVTHLQGQRLEGMLAQLADQVRALSPAGGGPEPPRKPVRLPPRPAFLAGREGLLAEVGTRLTAGNDPEPRLVALWGLGGAGKTSVAMKYAYQNLDEVGVAWQFPSAEPTVLAAGFGELAAQLGVGESGDPVVSVHAVLAASPAPWLLVFDNAPDRESVARFVPPAGPGRVLITSRNRIWPPGQSIEVPMLDPQVAAQFLVGRTGDPDPPAALDLAEELGRLPLALEQAAAYVQASGGSLAGYLDSFRQRRPEMLGRGEPTGYRQTVATTWQLAFEDVQQSAPGAAGLLRLLAFCAPEAIPLGLLLQPRLGLAERLAPEVVPVLAPLLEDSLAVGDAIAALGRYSLVTPADGSVSVHRLVQAVTADQMTAELAGQWRHAAAALIEAAIPDDPDLRGTWEVYAALLPHAQAVLHPTSDGMRQIAQYLGTSGNYPAARDLFQVIADIFRKDDAYGAEHQDTLSARANLAHYTGRAGDFAAARDQYAALLKMRERVSDPEHPDTLTTRDRLAYWYWVGRAGKEARARKELAALVPKAKKILGPENPETLTARGHLARFTGEAGNPAAARRQYAALLKVRERVLGREHRDTLTTRANLARWTGEAGDAAAARDQLTALLPVREQVSGTEHPHTLNARADLARFTGKAGDAAAARDQLAALLPVRERVSGPEHPHTLKTRQELADWTEQAEHGP